MKLNEIKNYNFADLQLIQIKSKIESLPVDEIYTLDEISKILKICKSNLYNLHKVNNKDLQDYTLKLKLNKYIQRYWANPKAIAKIKKEKPELCR